MPNERVIEIPWALQQLPQSGLILDVGSCEAHYLRSIPNEGRSLHCLDPRPCQQDIPEHALFFQQNLLGNTLLPAHYDAALLLSTLEHIGLPFYDQPYFPDGDRLALGEIRRLLKPGAPAIITVPVGISRVLSWSRQYAPDDLHNLFEGWRTTIHYWGLDGAHFTPIAEPEVIQFDYQDHIPSAGAVAGIVAYAN